LTAGVLLQDRHASDFEAGGVQRECDLKGVIRPGPSRSLDFVVLGELQKRTGIVAEDVLKFALSEMLCNALDKDDASEIGVDLQVDGDFYRLAVSDNGSKKLSAEEVRMIFDFERKASSKRGLHIVSRGYLGNALKCILGYSHALAESKGLKPPAIIVRSAGLEYIVTLTVNKMVENVQLNVQVEQRQDDGLTTFIVKFPKDFEYDIGALKNVIFATSMVNPWRKITYNILGESGSLGLAEDRKPLRKETSVLWYTIDQFLALYKDFVKAMPNAKLRDFIPLFRGFTSKKLVREILQELTVAVNHDSKLNENLQFLPSTPIQDLSENAVQTLFRIMREKAKPIGKRSVKSVLGCVGKESFEKFRERQGWKGLRYALLPGVQIECPEYYHSNGRCQNLNHVEFPYLVELAVFDRENDRIGLQVYQCVNFMASMEDIFSRLYNINYHLGRVGITKDMPVTVVVHLVCPVLKWLNYGKSELGE